MTVYHLAILIVALATFTVNTHDIRAEPDKIQKLGTVKVDDYTGQVLFQDPADDGKSYRITVAIPKPWESPSLRSERFEVWLLARGGKALAINTRPKGETLLEAGSAGATANAIFFFERAVEIEELRAVVVAVDGQPTAFKLNSEK